MRGAKALRIMIALGGILALIWIGLNEPIVPDESDCLARGLSATSCKEGSGVFGGLFR